MAERDPSLPRWHRNDRGEIPYRYVLLSTIVAVGFGSFMLGRSESRISAEDEVCRSAPSGVAKLGVNDSFDVVEPFGDGIVTITHLGGGRMDLEATHPNGTNEAELPPGIVDEYYVAEEDQLQLTLDPVADIC
jgi:hypothetical protein